MLASQFTLNTQDHGMRFIAPSQVVRDRPRLLAQGDEARRILEGLNRAVCGCPDGPFRWIALFNREDPS